MPIERLDHVQLAMPAGGEQSAIDFYCGLLGIPVVPKPPHLAARGGCWFERDSLKVHLGVDPGFRPATKAHPALIVSDLASLVTDLTGAGVVVVVHGRPDRGRLRPWICNSRENERWSPAAPGASARRSPRPWRPRGAR